jgi:hypothetical protein
LCALVLVGCGPGDPCDAFPGETCFSLEVRGPGLTVDQIGVHAAAGFPLDDGRSPASAGSGFGLPVRLAVLPPRDFAGAADLEVRGFLGAVLVGLDQVHATVAAGQHLGIIAELGNHASDLAGLDLSGKPDLAQPPGADLALPPGADLSLPPGADLAAASDFVVETSSVTDVEFNAVWGTSSSNVYLLSLSGDIFHSTGNGSWTLQHGRVANEIYTVLWGSGADDIWAGGGLFPCGGTGGPALCTPRLLHSTGNGSWTASTPPGSDANFGIDIQAIAGTGKNDLYFSVSGSMTTSGILHSTTDGASFEGLQAFGSMATPKDLFATSASAIYGPRGVADVMFSNGNGSWSPQTSGLAANDSADRVFATSPTNLYVAGTNFSSNQSDIYHSTGNGNWTKEMSTASLAFAQSITGSSATDLYASYDCDLLHSTGDGRWIPVPLPITGCPLRRAWAAPDGQVFIVGKKGLILHKR